MRYSRLYRERITGETCKILKNALILVCFVLLLGNNRVFAVSTKVLLVANETNYQGSGAFVEQAASFFQGANQFYVAAKLLIQNGDTVEKSLKAAQALGLDYIVSFDFENKKPFIILSVRLVDVERVEIVRVFYYQTARENFTENAGKYFQNKVLPFMRKNIATVTKTSILGEISLISGDNLIYLTMENNLNTPVGSTAEVYNNRMEKIGEIRITDFSDEFCYGVAINQSEKEPFEKGNIVKVNLGNGNYGKPRHHDEKSLICAECNGSGKQDCPLCEKGYILKDGRKVTCSLCYGSGYLPCEFCDGVGFINQP